MHILLKKMRKHTFTSSLMYDAVDTPAVETKRKIQNIFIIIDVILYTSGIEQFRELYILYFRKQVHVFILKNYFLELLYRYFYSYRYCYITCKLFAKKRDIR